MFLSADIFVIKSTGWINAKLGWVSIQLGGGEGALVFEGLNLSYTLLCKVVEKGHF